MALQENKQNDAQARTRYPPNKVPQSNDQIKPCQADRVTDSKTGGYIACQAQLDQEEDVHTPYADQINGFNV